jgi:hypothetical protein
MQVPKNVNKEKALEQLNGTIDNESAKWAGRLAEKVEAEEGFISTTFPDDMVAAYEKTARFLDGKDQKQFASSFHKLSEKERDAYEKVSAYKFKETKIKNSEVLMENSLSKINACTEVKELIQASITAAK